MALIPTPQQFMAARLPSSATKETGRTVRAVAAYGASSVTVSGGAFCPITAFRKDFDDTHITALNFATVASNIITLTRPGYYLVTYHTGLMISLKQASSVVPDTTIGKTVLKAGGEELPGTEGYFSMTEVPDLTGLLKLNGEETTPSVTVAIEGLVGKTAPFETVTVADDEGMSVDIGGATGLTDPFQEEEFTVYQTSGPGNGLTAGSLTASKEAIVTLDDAQTFPVTATPLTVISSNTLDGESKQGVTIDDTDIDGLVNFSGLTAEETAINDVPLKGSTSGTAMLIVRYNASNALKLFIDGTEYDPTVGVFGSRESGTADVISLNTSISIIKLF